MTGRRLTMPPVMYRVAQKAIAESREYPAFSCLDHGKKSDVVELFAAQHGSIESTCRHA
jgi:hypothetical protein